jgi:cytochrome c-type biogenesis protein CcmE
MVVILSLYMSMNQLSAEEVLKYVVGSIYQHFAEEPPPHSSVSEAAQWSLAEGVQKRVRLQGSVRSVKRRSERTLHFLLGQDGHSIQVSYSGAVPINFKEGGQVVVTGVLNSRGQLEASGVDARSP